MRNRFKLISQLAPLLLLGVALANPTALPAQGRRNPQFGGRWTLDYFAATRPGGETLAVGTGVISPQNLLFAARHEEFEVSDEGKFDWMERRNGQWHSDARLIVGGQSSHATQTNEPLLFATGQLDKERKLKLQLRWSHGSGPFTSGDGRPGSLTVSADGGTVSVMFQGNSSSHASKFLTAEWEFPPPQITKEEIGPDEQEERAVYSARRRRTLNEFGAGPLPVNESIRIEQIRPLKLVPRG